MGHYCLSRATVFAPTDGFDAGYVCSIDEAADLTGPSVPPPVTGDLCPTGHYCPAGSSSPTACPTGRFSPARGAGSSGACQACAPSYVCAMTGTSVPTVLCSAGYYCPGGQSSTTEFPCPAGRYCPSGSGAPIACPAGRYQTSTGSSNCTSCPARSYCEAGAVVPVACPTGFVCASGTGNSTQSPCPAGRYSNVTGLANVTECRVCPSGQYCGGVGNVLPTGPCGAGYYCLGSAMVPSPTDNVTGALCTVGHYCPYGALVGRGW